jgi:hypothetical protein
VRKLASFFEEVFGEKSLATGVKYLTIWTKEEKKRNSLPTAFIPLEQNWY